MGPAPGPYSFDFGDIDDDGFTAGGFAHTAHTGHTEGRGAASAGGALGALDVVGAGGAGGARGAGGAAHVQRPVSVENAENAENTPSASPRLWDWFASLGGGATSGVVVGSNEYTSATPTPRSDMPLGLPPLLAVPRPPRQHSGVGGWGGDGATLLGLVTVGLVVRLAQRVLHS